MVLSIDFGSSSAKCLCVFGANNVELGFFERPLGFTAAFRPSSADVVSYLISEAQFLYQQEVREVYASGDVAGPRVVRLLTAGRAAQTAEVLPHLKFPLIDIGGTASFVLGEEVREAEIVPADIIKWLPFESSSQEIGNYLANKALYGQIIPFTPRDLILEQGVGRAKLKHGLSHLGPHDWEEGILFLTGGVFSKAPSPRDTLLPLLDCLESLGSYEVFVDRRQVFPALATLGEFKPDLYKQISTHVFFAAELLGTVLVLGGATSLIVDTGLVQEQALDLGAGEVTVLPVGGEETITVRLTSGFWEAQEVKVRGGTVGVVLDTRPRPLVLPQVERERQRVLRLWHRFVAGPLELVEKA